MEELGPRTRVSTYFKLDRDQTTLDFIDVPIGADVAVFVDPSRFRTMSSNWASKCNSLLQHFFEQLLGYLVTNDSRAGLEMLEHLTEKNEFHLGLSVGKSEGRALGKGYALKLWNTLKNSKASNTGLLKDLEDTCLFVEGIGPDRISDAVCNIIRGPLIRYTQDMCVYYGIPMTEGVDSGPVWDPVSNRWEDSAIPLPLTPYGKLLFVPKIAVRHRLVYDFGDYIAYHLLPAMQKSEIDRNTGLVYTLRDGRKRVTKKSLKATYGADKLMAVDQTLKHPNALDEYRQVAMRRSQPITHDTLAEIEKIPLPNFKVLLAEVINVKPGKDEAGRYENAIEKLLSALFFPALSSPQKQEQIHDGRKRIDIRYVNDSPPNGFFYWLMGHYSSAHIFVECKNYGKEVGNPEIDQLSGRFSPSRGTVGLLVCRSLENPKKLSRSCRDTAADGRGYIIALTDEDLETLVSDYLEQNRSTDYPLLRRKFTDLII